jgi:CRISPR/Cas system CMR subunit Cmr6 (Cas7 group RAMP superfamily)
LAKLTQSIEKALEDYKLSLKGKTDPEEQRERMVKEIRESFLRYFVNIFKTYEKFLIGECKFLVFGGNF